MKKILNKLCFFIFILLTSQVVQATLIEYETVDFDFDRLQLGTVPNFFESNFASGDFRVDVGTVSNGNSDLVPSSGTQFVTLSNEPQSSAIFNDASWFLDISRFADDIDSGEFGVLFTFLGDTDNAQFSTGNIAIRGSVSSLGTSLPSFNEFVSTSSIIIETIEFDSLSGSYQSFSLFRDDFDIGTRSLQLNAGVTIGSGIDNSLYAIDDFSVTFFRSTNVDAPSTLWAFTLLCLFFIKSKNSFT